MENKHYDVGLIGWWHNSNYGSMLTYYALHQTLKNLGYSVLMIHEALGYPNRVKWDYNNPPHRFAKKHYDFREQVNYSELRKYNDECDAFIVGSDQLWNPHIGRVNSDCFLDFTDDDKKRISYGTSFGNAGVLESRPNFVKNNYQYLRRFDAVSVREDYAVQAAKSNFNVKAVRVADPVFLPDISEYVSLAEQASDKIDGEYLLAFILDPTEAKKNVVLGLAEKLGYKKIFVLTDPFQSAITKAEQIFNAPNMEMYKLEQISPENFLCAYQNAGYVITDSFHGTCFSYIFRKNFNVFYNILRGAGRFASVVGLMGLENRQIYEDEHTIPDTSPIDYTKAEKNVNELRDFSLNWLKNVLETRKQELPSILYKENVSIVTDNKKCTGCSACSLLCPVHAISMNQNADGFINAYVDKDKCIYCGLCVDRCIVQNPVHKNNVEPKCYAMQADDEIRKISSSGGMFTVAAEYILDQGGYVCGVAYNDDFTVKHIIIDDKEDLYKLRGSKYMQSHIGEIYHDIKKLLDNEKIVLFIGTPCQVAGLCSYLGKKYDDLYMIDLVCHGITSSKVFEKYYGDVLRKPLQSLEFKSKEPWGWHAGVNAHFTDGSKYSSPCEEDPYFRAYLNSVSKNTACGVCTVNRLPRQGDLTIGDFWGIEKEMNDNKGTSLVLLNSEKGEELFDKLKQFMKKVKQEPLQTAIKGNPSLKAPYKLQKNRDIFFEKLNDTDFTVLINACLSENVFERLSDGILSNIRKDERNLYFLAKAAAEHSNKRQIVTWTKSPRFEEILHKYFGLDVAFSIAQQEHLINNTDVFPVSAVKDGPSKYYVVAVHAPYNTSQSTLNGYGYNVITDFICNIPQPIVIKNFDLSKGKYEDEYGNTIIGSKGIISSVVFRGCNNHITIGKNVVGTERLSFDVTENSYFEIGDNCVLYNTVQVLVEGRNGCSRITIKNNCVLNKAKFRLFVNPNESSVFIDSGSTFEPDLELHANSGKKIKIGKDCMFSYDITVWSGDGHSIFDVETEKNINSLYQNLPQYKNELIIGNHVWVGKGANIMHGTSIGDGSIIGMESVVKGKFPNNCSIGGNPAKLIRKNIAWSRRNCSGNIRDCGIYTSTTEDE